MRFPAVIALVAVMLGAAPAAQAPIPHRVFDTAARQFIDFDAMVAALTRADVIFVGEQHDDPNTHHLEEALLQALGARREGIVLSLEMFERDVQPSLDRFLTGDLDEASFLKDARPWPRYATDYKGLVDYAMSRRWPVIAANVPRPIASEVAKSGTEVLAQKSDAEKAWFATERLCPIDDDEYYRRFAEVMGGHAGVDVMQRYYDSQCLKDETMAESITRAWQTAAGIPGPTRPLVVHYNGAFHSDFGLGTASRVRRRMPDQQIAVVTIVPLKTAEDLQSLMPEGDDLYRARFVIFTVALQK